MFSEIIVIDGERKEDSANKEKGEQAIHVISKEMAKELVAKQCQFFQWDDNLGPS